MTEQYIWELLVFIIGAILGAVFNARLNKSENEKFDEAFYQKEKDLATIEAERDKLLEENKALKKWKTDALTELKPKGNTVVVVQKKKIRKIK